MDPQSGKLPKQDEQPQRDHPYAIDHLKIDDPEYISQVPERLQNNDFPGFPTTVMSLGGPGSGKTNVLFNFLTQDRFYFKFFDKIYELGQTINADKYYKKINIPPDQKVSKEGEFITKLTEWTDKQIQQVEENPKEAPKTLFLFEDITSYPPNVQNSPKFIECFTTIRHHKAVAWVNVHKYKAFNRTCRMSCMHLMIWKVKNTEVRQLYDDFGPNMLSPDDFQVMCAAVWKPYPGNKKPFLYINMYKEEDERFRRDFTAIIDLNAFVGKGKALKKGLDSENKEKRPRGRPKKGEEKNLGKRKATEAFGDPATKLAMQAPPQDRKSVDVESGKRERRMYDVMNPLKYLK